MTPPRLQPDKHATAVAVVACALLYSVSYGDAPPNIILILTDDQAWNGTSVAMDPDDPRSASDFYQTPALEQLAAAGMRFSNAYSAASICSPTRAALQTGKSPAQLSFNDIARPTGVRSFSGLPLKPPQWRSIDESEETLPERIKAADQSYVTAHVGKWHLSPTNPLTVGYDLAPEIVDTGLAEDPATVFGRTATAIDFIEDRVDAQEPFFVQVSHFAVHNPIVTTTELLDKYQNLPRGNVHHRADYAAFTEALDQGVGQLLDRVDELGIRDNTYIIYASDNGARTRDTSNAPLSGQKTNLMEGGIRTPLLISGPGIAADSSSSVPVTTVDLFATISDLVGNDTPFAEGVEGASLRPLLENNGQLPEGVEHLERQYSEGGALFFSQPLNLGVGPNYRTRPMSAVRKDNYKLLRIHGENGNPDRDFLFDFNETLSETEFGGGPDISFDNPEKTAELGALLDNWMQQVDASLAYDVAAPINMLWTADAIGDHPDRWRSVTNVDQQWRETWEVTDDNARPTRRAIETHLVGAPANAMHFDGDDRLGRRFFDVADGREREHSSPFDTGVADFDRSVTFEWVLRLDDLDQDQVLFETGTTSYGLSLTLGDADADGVHDEARFRILSVDGKHLVVTADVDTFARPTQDYVQLTAVFNDDPADRHAELFVNGASIGRTEGAAGEDNSLQWDNFVSRFNAASLGGEASNNIGGNSGGGDRPFTGGSLRGSIASFRFVNHAVDGAQVQQNYAALLDAPDAGVVETTGSAAVVDTRPSSVAKDAFELDGTLRVMKERTAMLSAPLAIDVVAQDGASIALGGDAPPLVGGVLDESTDYTSYLLHFDAETTGGSVVPLAGSITFEDPIIGLLVSESGLDETDLIMGVAGEFALVDRSIEDSGVGAFQISNHRRTLSFGLLLDPDELLQLRVLTETDFFLPPPSPGDFNEDRLITAADYAVWRDGGSETPGPDGYADWSDGFTILPESFEGDFNFDGAGTAADYVLWRDRAAPVLGPDGYQAWLEAFGRQSVLASTSAVPEPASGLLAAASIGLAAAWRRSRRAGSTAC